VVCRLLLEEPAIGDAHRLRLADYASAGVEIRLASSLPMKLAVFDGKEGMIALLDPVITRPAWTAVVFRHEGMGEAMKGLFEDHWRRSKALAPGA
jgi:hypothetical protein